MTNHSTYDQASKYKIRIQGILDSCWSDWFGGFSITIHGNETILVGVAPDQSALHGILAKINDLGLSLISVTKLSQDEQDETNPPALIPKN